MLLSFPLAALNARSGDRDSCRGGQTGAVDLDRDQVIPSPDQKYRVVLGGYNENAESGRGSMRAFEGPKLLSKFTLKGLSPGVFLNWAPDSKAFILMWSAGGAIGRYHVRVFRVRGNRVTELTAVKIAEREFARKHYCQARGSNLFALRWLEDSNSLLIAPGVYGTSDCGKDMGLTMAYLVRTDDGRIIKRYSKPEIENLFRTCSPFMD